MLIGRYKTIDDSGAIMVIVLVIIIVMAILSVTILSQSLSQSKTGEDQVKQIIAEELTKGIFWKEYNEALVSGTGVPSDSGSITLDNPRHIYTYAIAPCVLTSTCVQVNVIY